MRGVRSVQRAGCGGGVTVTMSTTGAEFLAAFGGPATASASPVRTEEADPAQRRRYHELRRETFVVRQGLFEGSDLDDLDDHDRLVVVVAVDTRGDVVGGVRLAPCADPDIGWWAGSRLVAAPGAPPGTGAALVRAACARAEVEGVLRFDATVQADKLRFFQRLGWAAVRDVQHRGAPHVEMRWLPDRLARQAASKSPIADVLDGLRPGPSGFVGDDGAPVPGTDVVAACDAVLPSMVERDPWWAGWCSVLVNANDLAAMGAAPVGLLDAVAAPTASLATRVMAGLRAAAERWEVPVLGGHTQVGVPASLSVTMLGRTIDPVPGGGGRPGQDLTLVADLGGGWRQGYSGRQWDSTTARSPAELRHLHGTVARSRPAAAKDVSMAGILGTVAMLAESSGCGAVVDVSDLPKPPGATTADWLTCFPGFAMVLAGGVADSPGPAVAASIGSLRAERGVELRWPDGACTPALPSAIVGLGPAALESS